MLKKAMCCLSMITMMFTIPIVNKNNISLSLTEHSAETDKLNVNDINKYYVENPIIKEYNYHNMVKKEINKKVNARLKSIEEDNINMKKKIFDLKLTFYTYVECVDGKNAITCHGDKPYQGIVASNVYPQGTILYIEGFGNVKVWDRGGNDFHSSNRLDVFIDPLPGESNNAYQQRAYNMGIVNTKGYIIEQQ